MQDTGYWIQDTRSRILDSGFKMQDPGDKIAEVGVGQERQNISRGAAESAEKGT